MSTNRFGRILQALVEHDVRFVIVGGVAAVLQRVPVTTMDLDIVHDRRPDNVERLLAALAMLQATYRNDPRRLTPSASHLIGPGSQLLRVGLAGPSQPAPLGIASDAEIMPNRCHAASMKDDGAGQSPVSAESARAPQLASRTV